MRQRTLGPLALAACLLAVPASAQNNVERQLFLEIRTLQSQVQQLTLAVNLVAEQLKRTDARVDSQASALLKGFADQKGLIDAIAAAQRALNERESDSSVRVLQLNAEMQAIRQGLTQQQALLNQILALLQQPPAAGDPAAATTTPQRAGGAVPASPTEYYTSAFGFFYGGQYESAVQALTDAIKKYPDHPQAASAQLTIGEAYYSWPGHDKEALAAYGLVIQNYPKDRDVVPDAYYKQGLSYERLGQKDAARKSFEYIRNAYPPDSAAAILAVAALKRMGFIK